MKITFTNEESQQHFLSAMCNGLGYISDYGLQLSYKEAEYKSAKKKLESPCWEDVLLQILIDGNSLSLYDGNDDVTHTITIQDVYNRLPETPMRHLMDMVNQQDDAVTADVILQTIFLEEVIYG
jgi:hypothetical protein